MSGRPDPRLCACGCGRPRDREGQRYRRDCATAYMRVYRARQKRRGIAGLARLVAELEHASPGELELDELGDLVVDAAKMHARLNELEDRLAELTRRWFIEAERRRRHAERHP